MSDEIETALSAGHHEHPETHGGTIRTFFMVFLGLLVLTAISFTSAIVFHGTPVVSWVIMMAISCLKALLVISFFMHLLWEANWKYVLTIPASIMSLLLLLALVPDIGQRVRRYSEERLRHAAVQREEEHTEHEAPATAGKAAHQP
jgi:cytochrome c oxidase subunit 4